MKNLRKWITLLLAVVLLFTCASCKKDNQTEFVTNTPEETVAASETQAPTTEEQTVSETVSETESASAATDTTKKSNNSNTPNTQDKSSGSNSSSGSKDNTPVIYPPSIGGSGLVGTWSVIDSITPSEIFTDEFLQVTNFNTNFSYVIQYVFSSNGDFTMSWEPQSVSSYWNSLYDAYKIYYAYLDPTMSEDYLDRSASYDTSMTMNELLEATTGSSSNYGTQLSGTYTKDDAAIYYSAGGQSFSETYRLDGNKLTLTGSSMGNEGYPVTLTRR